MSFKIEGHKFYSIIGESGLGKSTILSLIFRFFDPDNGDIYLDGQNLKDLKMESFRKDISIVSQNTYLFNMSIIENLRYANQSLTDD